MENINKKLLLDCNTFEIRIATDNEFEQENIKAVYKDIEIGLTDFSVFNSFRIPTIPLLAFKFRPNKKFTIYYIYVNNINDTELQNEIMTILTVLSKCSMLLGYTMVNVMELFEYIYANQEADNNVNKKSEVQ